MDLPLAGLGSVALMLLAAAAAGLLVRELQRRARLRATGLPEGQRPLRVARALPGRLYVERSVVGGPQAGGINRGATDLVLGPGQLLAATRYGRVLQIDASHPGSASCTGPRRLVLEGSHPSGSTRVRLEVVVPDAEGWAREVSELAPR